jgi:hypothetical protein
MRVRQGNTSKTHPHVSQTRVTAEVCGWFDGRCGILMVGVYVHVQERRGVTVNIMSKMGLSQQIIMAVVLLMVFIASSEAFAPSSAMFPGTRPSSFSSRQTAFSSTAAMSPSIQRTRTSSSSSLQMVTSGVAVAAITGAITGGLFAGSLHAISGK